MTTCLLLTSYILLCLQIALILAFFTKPWSETEDHLFGLKADSCFYYDLATLLDQKNIQVQNIYFKFSGNIIFCVIFRAKE